MDMPAIAILMEAGEWPPEPALRKLAEAAVAAAVEALGAFPRPLRGRVREGGRPPLFRREGEGAELSILFTDNANIRNLNNRFRGKDKPTNVLSFPQESGPLLGDIVLASETVRNEAALAGKPVEAHIAHLIVHGFFHLIGYDHAAAEEAEAMEALERDALGRMGIADPYAAQEQ
jgi:probable rRNA maturation factor